MASEGRWLGGMRGRINEALLVVKGGILGPRVLNAYMLKMGQGRRFRIGEAWEFEHSLKTGHLRDRC